MLIQGHGHKWSTKTLQEEGYYLYDMIVSMAPSSHANQKLRPENERRGFNIINLIRQKGYVSHVEVIPYEMKGVNIYESQNARKKFKITWNN
jgi:hypothetical protein